MLSSLLDSAAEVDVPLSVDPSEFPFDTAAWPVVPCPPGRSLPAPRTPTGRPSVPAPASWDSAPVSRSSVLLGTTFLHSRSVFVFSESAVVSAENISAVSVQTLFTGEA